MPGNKTDQFKKPAPVVAPPPTAAEELSHEGPESSLEDQTVEFMEIERSWSESSYHTPRDPSTDPLNLSNEAINYLDQSIESLSEYRESKTVFTSTQKSPLKPVRLTKSQLGSQAVIKSEAELVKDQFGVTVADSSSDEDTEELKKCKTTEADSTTSPSHQALPTTAPAVPDWKTIKIADSSSEEEPENSEVPFRQEIIPFAEALEECKLEFALKHC